MAPKFGGAPNCVRCQKAVYMAEQVIGPSGAYHKHCLTCKECSKRLDSTTLAEREGEAYCKVCHSRKWGIKGYGFAGGASFLSTEDKLPREILENQQRELMSPPNLPRQSDSPNLPPRLNDTSPRVSDDRPSLPSRRNENSPSLPPRISSPGLPPRPAGTAQPDMTTTTRNNNDSDNDNDGNIDTIPVSTFWSKKYNTTSAKCVDHPPTLPIRPPVIPPKPAYASYQTTSYVPKKLNFGIQNDICTKCGKAVYAAELALGAGNKYHKWCLKCFQCQKILSSTNMQDRDSELYCRGCYSKSFGPKGYGYGNLLTPEGATR